MWKSVYPAVEVMLNFLDCLVGVKEHGLTRRLKETYDLKVGGGNERKG